MTDLTAPILETLATLFGSHPRTRAAHAKGSYWQATFTASPDAAALTRAPHLQGQPTGALVRFSNGSGDPASSDADTDGRGMAVKFDVPGGGHTDIVALTLPVFFARTPEAFLDFTRMRVPDPQTGQPDPAAVGAFIAAHPEAMPAIQAAIGARPPASFAQLVYHGIHAYRFVDANGGARFVRYRWDPEAGEASLDPDQARARGADYLREELAGRVARGPVVMQLSAVVAAPGDPTDDPTAQWPEDRARVALGRLQITAPADDPERDGSVVVFDPTNVVDGIELSADPILEARRLAYSESAARRSR